MTLEEALEWCIENEVEIEFYHYNGKARIAINSINYPLPDGVKNFVEAVEQTQATLFDLHDRSKEI
jgi:hypothetical protein